MTENEFLAVNVMGWRLVKQDHDMDFYEIEDSTSIEIIWFKDWNPRKNIDQAFILITKFNKYEWEMRWQNGYFVDIYKEDYTHSFFKPIGSGVNEDSICDAIVDAVLAASGYGE